MTRRKAAGRIAAGMAAGEKQRRLEMEACWAAADAFDLRAFHWKNGGGTGGSVPPMAAMEGLTRDALHRASRVPTRGARE